MKKVIFFISLFVLTVKTNAQLQLNWAKSLTSNATGTVRSIAVDSKRNIYTTGGFSGHCYFEPANGSNYYSSGGSRNMYISKIDSQGNFLWAKIIGGSGNKEGNSIKVDSLGFVYITGYFNGITDFNPNAGVYNLTSTGSDDIFILKLDSAGNFVWAKRIGSYFTDRGNSLELDRLGNIYITGRFKVSSDFDPDSGVYIINTSYQADEAFILKLSPLGNFIWAKSFKGPDYSHGIGYSIVLDSSCNVYTTGTFSGITDFDPGTGTHNLNGLSYNMFISKLDSSGNFVWAKAILDTQTVEGLSIALDRGGNVYTTGHFNGKADFDPGLDTFFLSNSSILEYDMFVCKLNNSGDFVWAKQIGGSQTQWGQSIILDKWDNIYTTGCFYGTADFDPNSGIHNLTSNAYNSDIFILKLNALGNFVYAVKLGTTLLGMGNAIAFDNLNNIYFTGTFNGICNFDPSIGTYNLNSNGAESVFVTKMFQQGIGIQENFNKIKGKVFMPSNTNCVQDTGEKGLPNLLMIAKPYGYSSFTDSVGRFTVYTDSGTFQLKPMFSPYLLPLTKNLYCPSTGYYIMQFDSLKKDTSGFNFAQEISSAPLLSIEFTQDRLRRCFNTTGLIKFSNLGTRDTNNVKIIVTLPNDISYITASKTPVINGKILTFNIDTLRVGDCGYIFLETKVDCISGLTGQTRCYKLHITPENNTYKNIANKSGYDKSKVNTDVICVGDSILKFKISNNGDNMNDSSTFRIFKDAELGFTGKFKLKTNESKTFPIVSTGHTYRIEADQTNLYPTNSNPNASIENCGPNSSNHLGYITKLPPYYENLEYKEHCLRIRDSYDPNDKTVNPEGIGSSHIVTHKVPLHYNINFQNTGSDTAYTVVLVDTLSTKFDMSTLIIGSASHPYKISFTGRAVPVINFIFDNIYLVDSSTNEKGSHGFISYSILPYDSIQNGTVIKNTADIYFDFNAPVRTNTTVNTIDDRLPSASTPIKILFPSFDSINIKTCSSYISPSKKFTWTTSNIYKDTILNFIGGDSVITINLIINNPTISTINITSCNIYKSPSGKYIWTSSGTYKDTILNLAGCDSVITINLKINNSSSSINNITSCNNYSSPSKRYIWTSSNSYIDTIPNLAGCDSIITINLTIHNWSSRIINVVSCDKYKSPSGKYIWTSSNTYKDTIPNKVGCDSFMTINLLINNSTYSILNPTTCLSYTSPSNKYLWKYSGTFNDTIPNMKACDSIITINLTINNLDTTVNRIGNTLSANIAGATYQWLNCNNGFSIINGAINQSYTPTSNGRYAVKVTKNSCVDTSSCLTLIISGISSSKLLNQISVVPNPNDGIFSIDLGKRRERVSITIVDVLGRNINEGLYENSQVIDFKIPRYDGLYFIIINTENETEILKFIVK